MTQLLEKVLAEVYKLPSEKQDAIAAVILEELEDEQLGLLYVREKRTLLF